MMEAVRSGMGDDEAHVVIVPYCSDDLDQMMDIEVRTFAIPWSRQSYEDLAPLDTIHIWVAKRDEEVVGYMLYQFFGEEMELHNIAVKPELQRRGIATKLMDLMLEQARAMGIVRIYLLVRPSNLPARMLYEKYHFKTVGVRHRYYRDNGENALIMCLEKV